MRITGLTQQAGSNTAYTVAATTTGTVVITLPPSPQVGDTFSVTGESANAWRIAQNPAQTVLTTGVSGNVAPGTVWTPRLTERIWHWLAASSTGEVLVGGEAAGPLSTSSDGGATWTAGDSPAGPTWISIDMSATGDRIVAVQYGGRMYTSINRGVNWTPVAIPDLDTRPADPSPDLTNQPYESVTVSRDGQRIVAAVQDGPLIVSSNAGQNWVAGTLGGTLLTGFWRAVDSSADGMTVMAASQSGDLYRSTDGGLTWTARNVTVGAVPVLDNWYRLKMSADGNVVTVVGNSYGGSNAGTGIYMSRDAGATWTLGTPLVADYSAIAMSADGQIIAVTVSDPNPTPPPGTPVRATGRVLRSTDGGVTFTAVAMPGVETNWRAIAMSSDGNRLAAAIGLFQTADPGRLYTSQGNRTSAGSLGSFTGGQGLTAEFTYLGKDLFGIDQFSVTNSSGGAFQIQ